MKLVRHTYLFSVVYVPCMYPIRFMNNFQKICANIIMLVVDIIDKT